MWRTQVGEDFTKREKWTRSLMMYTYAYYVSSAPAAKKLSRHPNMKLPGERGFVPRGKVKLHPTTEPPSPTPTSNQPIVQIATRIPRSSAAKVSTKYSIEGVNEAESEEAW